jgi:hypothetical protein
MRTARLSIIAIAALVLWACTRPAKPEQVKPPEAEVVQQEPEKPPESIQRLSPEEVKARQVKGPKAKVEQVIKAIDTNRVFPDGDVSAEFTYQNRKYKIRYSGKPVATRDIYYWIQDNPDTSTGPQRVTYITDVDLDGVVDSANHTIEFGEGEDSKKLFTHGEKLSPARGLQYQQYWQEQYERALDATIAHGN